MPLLTMHEMLAHARAHKYTIPAYNVYDLQGILGLRLAAEQEDAPVILAGADLGNGIGNPASEMWARLALDAARESSAPIAVHLDHGQSFASTIKAIRLGFSSVMIDASSLPYEENVTLTKKVAEAAHAVGVTVEAEIGHVGMGADELTDELRAKLLTDPEEAERFVADTGVDAVAVAVGTLHGAYKFPPRIDWERLERIIARVPAFIVLHGASGTPELERAVALGVTKMNIGTEIANSLVDCLKEELPKGGFNAVKGMLNAAPAAQRDAMARRLRFLGASGQGKALLDARPASNAPVTLNLGASGMGEFG